MHPYFNLLWKGMDDFRNDCGGGVNPLLKAINNALSANAPSTTFGPTTTGSPTSLVPITSTITSTADTSGPCKRKFCTFNFNDLNDKLCIFKNIFSVTCTSESQLLPDPDDCTVFYRCHLGVPEPMKCPTGEVFNPISLQCDWPYNVPGCENAGGVLHL